MHQQGETMAEPKPVKFACGLTMKNRFMLAPMTNCQSHDDGALSDDEFRWLTMRAKGGFGLTMTCAAHVQRVGQGFPGQLGIYSDTLLPGHERLAKAITEYGSLAVIQLHHAGFRSPAELIGEAPVGPSDNEKRGCRGLNTEEVQRLRDDFIAAAIRAKRAGYHGVEIHGAHGYIIAQFISPQYNQRTDEYGGTLSNRARLLFEIVSGVREQCGNGFLLGVRLSPERFGMKLSEVLEISQQLIDSGDIDFLDISLWDSFKAPAEAEHRSKSLLEHVVGLKMADVQLTVAGQIRTASEVHQVLAAGVDFVSIGRAGVLHHDFPVQVLLNDEFEPVSTPVSADYLANEGLGPAFIEYMRRWDGFVEPHG